MPRSEPRLEPAIRARTILFSLCVLCVLGGCIFWWVAPAWGYVFPAATGELHVYLRQTSAGAFNAQQFTIAEPTESGTVLPATGAGQEYRLKTLTIDTTTSVAITLRNNDGIVWMHTVPVGIGTIALGDKGIRFGAGKTIFLTTGTFVGTVRGTGTTNDATTGVPYPLGK